MLKNVWYMAGLPSEIKAGEVLERSIAGQSIVFFRGLDGKVAALFNRCPHRFAPLHLGELTASCQLRCKYHGLEFGADGKCSHNPHGDGKIPEAARVPAYVTSELHSIVWIWLGDPSLADESKIPDFSMIGESRSTIAWRYLKVNANYQLETDNIMDLSHIQFLHPSTLGSGAVQDGITTVDQEGSTVYSRRFIQNEDAPAFVRKSFSIPDGSRNDRWLDVRWNAPSSMLLTITAGITGTPKEQGRTVVIPHLFTPLNAKETHYWYAVAYDRIKFPGDQRAAVERHVDGLAPPFTNEDLPMLQAQQSVIGDQDFWSLNPILLPSDAAAVRARRVHDELLRAESAETAPRVNAHTIEALIVERRTEAEGIISLMLQAAPGQSLPAFEAGAHIDVHIAPGLVRQYSLCNDPRETGSYSLGILREPSSRGGSEAVHAKFQTGQRITISAPRNQFRLNESATHSILTGGGIGITPLMAMAWRLHALGKSFELHYCTRSLARTAFRERLTQTPFADRIHFHTDDGAAEQKFNAAELLKAPKPGTHLYACGPSGFMTYVTGEAQRLAWASDHVHVEYFAAEVSSSGAAFTVKAARSGKELFVPADKSLSTVLIANGINLPLSCEQGVCGTCLVNVLEGTPDHRDMYLSDQEHAANTQMTPCCSRSKTPVLVLDI